MSSIHALGTSRSTSACGASVYLDGACFRQTHRSIEGPRGRTPKCTFLLSEIGRWQSDVSQSVHQTKKKGAVVEYTVLLASSADGCDHSFMQPEATN